MTNALAKIRSERDLMSAIERRLADFILDNAQLLRDYSSQQLADSLKISQSSVVKFAQKLGFKGYPDLKLSVNEAVVRADSAAILTLTAEIPRDNAQGYDLWMRKTEAEEATRLINPPGILATLAEMMIKAQTIYTIGIGEDDLHARALALRLPQFGIQTLHNSDASNMAFSLCSAKPNDILMIFSEHGSQAAFGHLARYMRAQHGQVVGVTRHSANLLRSNADISLLVAAHDDRPHVEPLLYRTALQHLLDRLLIRIYEAIPRDRDCRRKMEDHIKHIFDL